MPAVSQAQYRLMQAAKHDPEVRERTGITPKVAKEFTQGSPKDLPERAARAKAIRRYKTRY